MTEDLRIIREIRINPVVPTESVLVATERSVRPRMNEERIPHDEREWIETCPFCRGNEDKTPPTIRSYPDEQNWEIRIVPNLYPVLGDDTDEKSLSLGLQQVIDGYGRHEVLIDHPNHGMTIDRMSVPHLQMLFQAYRNRMDELYSADDRLKYVLVFKNFGSAAGASIAHTHSQIVATPVVPENVYNEVFHSRAYYGKHHHCVFCTLIDEALTYEATIYDRQSGEVRRKINVGQYVIERGKHFVAIKPFASRFEWEVHILPLVHKSDFMQVTGAELEDFALVLKRTMQRLEQVIGGVQYNYFLHTRPRCEEYMDCESSYHWHLEICPRTSIPTGFELGSGLFVSTISPEDAASRLSEVQL